MKIPNIKFKCAFSATLFLAASFLFGSVKGSAQLLKPGEIIYSRAATVPGGNCDSATIWAVGQDGSNDRLITHGLHPRISPDGRLILFKRFPPEAACGPFFNGPPQWWILDLTTKQETHISSNGFTSLGHVFSPETNRADNQIMFDDALQSVCRMNLDGSNRVCNFFSPRISGHMSVRGGDSMVAMGVFDTNLVSQSGMSTFTYDFGNLQKIPNTSLGDLDPAWSNDGQTIAYAFFPGGRGEPYFFTNLFKIQPDGSNKTQLTSLNPPFGEGFSYSLVWTLDNSTILNAAKLNGVAGIYKIAANGSGVLGTIPITPGAAPEWVGGIAPAYSEQQVASFGGGLTRGGSYSLVDTIGQAFAGQTSSGGTYNLQSGFWPNLANRRSRADFDGDGRSDVSVQRPGDGSWFAIRSSDGSTFTNTWGNTGDVTTPGDFDGDGKTDLAVYRASSGQWFVLRSSDSSVTIANWGNPGDVPEIGDFDGDGKTDITVYRLSTGVWYSLRSSDGSVTISGWGNPGDVPVPADFDGDGKTDVAVYRPSTGVWYSLRTSDGGVSITAWGQPGDKPVEADYDGDGKDDFGVYRPSDNNWYILNSAGGVTIANWGNATDVPVPGDYDGDGKSDIAVFRTGNWYILKSTGGVAISALGTTGDVAIPARYIP